MVETSDPLVSETRKSCFYTKHIDFEYVLLNLKPLLVILG